MIKDFRCGVQSFRYKKSCLDFCIFMTFIPLMLDVVRYIGFLVHNTHCRKYIGYVCCVTSKIIVV